MSAHQTSAADGEREFVSMNIADQLFGVEVSEIGRSSIPRPPRPFP
jgi:hypothetical protein